MDIKDTFPGGILLAIVMGIAGFIAGDVANPGVAEKVLEPVSSIVVVTPCPPGWAFESANDSAQHVRVESCIKDGWHVFLNSEQEFDHAVREGVPGDFVFDSNLVPGWR